jgi:hypothetical protein
MPWFDCDRSEERRVPHWLVRATPTAGLCLILLVDGVQHVKAWPVPVMGLLDESAHLITAALVLGSVPRAAVRSVWPGCSLGRSPSTSITYRSTRG